MVAFHEMRDKLLTLEQAQEIIELTEPLEQIKIPIDSSTRFFLEPSWNHGIAAIDGAARVAASVAINRKEYPLTKDGLLDAASRCGLSKSYVQRTPPHLIEDHLNYWYSEGLQGERPLKFLVSNNIASAVTRETVVPFSNVELLNSLVDGVKDKFNGAEIYVDRKFHHSMLRTHLRLVIPSQTFTVEGTEVLHDEWSLGLNLRNSLVGAPTDQTSIEGYLFRWWCTNGAIDKRATSGRWNRTKGGQDPQAVYDWARESVDEVLGGLETAFESLQAMARTPLGSNAQQIVRDTFRAHKIPLRDRERVMSNLLTSSENVTAYTLMNAITSVANLEDRDFTDQQRLMAAGGDLPHVLADRCETCHQPIPD